jgi:hypothetical protein
MYLKIGWFEIAEFSSGHWSIRVTEKFPWRQTAKPHRRVSINLGRYRILFPVKTRKG